MYCLQTTNHKAHSDGVLHHRREYICPVAGSIASFIGELTDLITSIVANINDKLLYGNFNCSGVDGSHVDDDLQLLWESFGFELLVHKPMLGDNLLDVLAFGDRGMVNDVYTDDAGLIFDHQLIHCKIMFVVRPVEVSFWKTNRIYIPTF